MSVMLSQTCVCLTNNPCDYWNSFFIRTNNRNCMPAWFTVQLFWTSTLTCRTIKIDHRRKSFHHSTSCVVCRIHVCFIITNFSKFKKLFCWTAHLGCLFHSIPHAHQRKRKEKQTICLQSLLLLTLLLLNLTFQNEKEKLTLKFIIYGFIKLKEWNYKREYKLGKKLQHKIQIQSEYFFSVE